MYYSYEILKKIADLTDTEIGNYYNSEGKIVGHWLDIQRYLETDELTDEDNEYNHDENERS